MAPPFGKFLNMMLIYQFCTTPCTLEKMICLDLITYSGRYFPASLFLIFVVFLFHIIL